METLPATPDHANAVAAMNDRKLQIPGDVVNRATADLPDDQRSAIRWLHAYGDENNLSLGELGDKLRLSSATLSLVFRGKYEARLDNVVAEIVSFRDLTEKRATGRKLEFIPTRLSNRIETVCSTALEFQRIGFVFGESQIGKSEALRHYARTHNHGSTIYVEMPTGGSITNFLAKLATALRISPQQRERDLRRRIIESFDDRMLLIVDEAHRCIRPEFSTLRPIQSIEFVRELYDERRCGVVICATNVFKQALENGPCAAILKQTRRRRICALQLPDRPPVNDLNTFARAYGLDPASGTALRLQERVIEEEALGMWLCVLRMAAKLSAETKRRMSWTLVAQAHEALMKMETYAAA